MRSTPDEPRPTGGRPTDYEEPRTARMEVWATAEQRALITRAAKRAGMKRSTWALQHLIRHARAELGED